MKAGRKRTYTWVEGIYTGFVLLYIFLPTRMYYIDGVFYAEHLENIPFYVNGFHPHHLLYLPIMHAIYAFFSVVFQTLRAMVFLQGISAIGGALTILLFSFFLRERGYSVFTQCCGMLLLGFSYTFWHHSTDANIYILANLLTFLVIYFVFTDRFHKSPVFQVWIGLLLGFAGLIHQMSLFAIIPLAWYIIASTKSAKEKFKPVLRFTLSTVLILVIVYPTVFALYHGDVSPTLSNFFRWTGAFGQASHYFAFNEEHGGNLIDNTARGHTNAFFALKPLEVILFDQRSGDTKVSLRAYKFILFLTILSVIIFVLVNLSERKNPEKRLTGWFLIFLFMVYFIITSLFMPENHFYRIFYLPALIAIWMASISYLPQVYRTVLKPLAVTAITAFIIFNFVKGIYPESKTAANPYLRITGLLDTFVTDEDVVVFDMPDRYFTGIYRYFGKGDALHIQKGTHFIGRGRMFENLEMYDKETLRMLHDRYEHIYIAQEAFDTITNSRDESGNVEPVIFSPNNYRLPHPDFMIVKPQHFNFVKWHEVWDGQSYRHYYFMEVELK